MVPIVNQHPVCQLNLYVLGPGIIVKRSGSIYPWLGKVTANSKIAKEIKRDINDDTRDSPKSSPDVQ